MKMGVRQMNDRSAHRIFPVLIFLAALIFLIDIRVPRGATMAICYLPLLMVAAGFRSPRRILILAMLTTILTILDVFLSPPNDLPLWVTLNNRGLTLAAGWFIVLLSTTSMRRIWISGLSGMDARGYPSFGGQAPSLAGGPAMPRMSLDATSTLSATSGSRRSTGQRGRHAAQRIALVAHTNAPWTAPYARYFQSAGRDVQVISFHPDLVPGVTTAFIGVEPFDAEKNKELFITRVPRARRILQDFEPDIVLACYAISNGLTAALAWNGPLVVSARGGCILRQTRTGEPGKPSLLRHRVLKFVTQRADAVHAVSAEIEEAILSLGIERERIHRFPLGVDLQDFAWGVRVPRAGELPHVICTRRHEPVYQNHVIVEALAQLRNTGRPVRCTFVGGGTLLEARRAQARDLGVDDLITFVGQRPPDELPSLLRGANFYVSASSSDGTSTSLLEALAIGLYPIVSNIRANQAWIRDGETGRLFEVGDSSHLANALSDAIESHEAFEVASRDNRRLVELEGDRSDCSARLLELLDRVSSARIG